MEPIYEPMKKVKLPIMMLFMSIHGCAKTALGNAWTFGRLLVEVVLLTRSSLNLAWIVYPRPALMWPRTTALHKSGNPTSKAKR